MSLVREKSVSFASKVKEIIFDFYLIKEAPPAVIDALVNLGLRIVIGSWLIGPTLERLFKNI
jgi:hypothetical protein